MLAGGAASRAPTWLLIRARVSKWSPIKDTNVRRSMVLARQLPIKVKSHVWLTRPVHLTNVKHLRGWVRPFKRLLFTERLSFNYYSNKTTKSNKFVNKNVFIVHLLNHGSEEMKVKKSSHRDFQISRSKQKKTSTKDQKSQKKARWSTRSTMITDDQRWSTMINDDQRWSTMINDDQRWSTMIKDDQRWSTMINDDQR